MTSSFFPGSSTLTLAQRGPHRGLRSALTRAIGGWPWLTAAALGATVAGTCTRLWTAGAFDALRRDPAGLAHGQLWRLVTPVLVQGDPSVLSIIAVFITCAAVGVLGEALLSRRAWISLYVLGILVGHGIGEVFQPHQSGTSVAFAAILGGIAARVLRDNRYRFWLLIPLALLDTVVRDIHGLPFLAGLLAGLLITPSRPSSDMTKTNSTTAGRLRRRSKSSDDGRSPRAIPKGNARPLVRVAYSALAWVVVFFAFHVYWYLGGSFASPGKLPSSSHHSLVGWVLEVLVDAAWV